MKHLIGNLENLHHAYLIEGNSEVLYPKICQFCENDLKIKIKGNQDFIYIQKDKFIVADARRLREMQLNKTIEGGKQIFVISFNFITREAQNSLLKVLEEPTSRTHFFIITPTSNIFLKTVLSRVVLIKYSHEPIAGINPKTFIGKSISSRNKDIQKIVDNIKDEKISKVDAINFIRAIKLELYNDLHKNKNYKDLHRISNLEKLEQYLHDNSASVKKILENVAILV